MVSSVGLNNQVQVRNHSYTSTGMCPTACENFSPKNLIARWYTDNASNVTLVPRSNPMYACIYYNKSASPATPVHSGGNFRLDKYVVQELVTPGKELINYSYSPVAGYVKGFPHMEICDLDVPGTSAYMNWASVKPTTISYVAPVTPNANANPPVLGSGAYLKASSTTQYTYGVFSDYTSNYSQNLECAPLWNPKRGMVSTLQAQPQVHVGMLAIPQLSPDNETTTFMNACLYFQVHCSISLSYDLSTCWTNSGPRIRLEHALFSHSKNKYYGDPETVCGIAQLNGVFSMSNLEELEQWAIEADATRIAERINRLRVSRDRDDNT
uniref:Uncharacterized protein n=1 Tax=Cacopsylla melanoneura TaxID=428564 RepID=A0A8D8TPT5_9HEMI